MNTFEVIDKLYTTGNMTFEECVFLLGYYDDKDVRNYLFEKSGQVRDSIFGKKIYIRGLIEFSNYCKNDCYYCGIRRSNAKADRYRLTKEEILECCKTGYKLGFRTFVLQGGEDGYFTDDVMVDIVSEIRNNYPDCAITLSLGEKDYDAYKRLYDAGADRYLLRHETINPVHYSKLHPDNLKIETRVKCLEMLKEIGYQVGCGFMVGSPYQTVNNIAQDIMFIKKFEPHMIGVGPFISHKDTPFSDFNNGTAEMTVFIIGILRLMLRYALIPSTTALGTISKSGREEGIIAGTNVVMPNLSPVNNRNKYMLYDNKISTGEEAAESKEALVKQMQKIGFEVVTDRGDYKKI